MEFSKINEVYSVYEKIQRILIEIPICKCVNKILSFQDYTVYFSYLLIEKW